MKWDLRWIAAWIVLALSVLFFELVSLLDGNEATPPLTQVVVQWVPGAVIMAFIAWLGIHFWRRIQNKNDPGGEDE